MLRRDVLRGVVCGGLSAGVSAGGRGRVRRGLLLNLVDLVVGERERGALAGGGLDGLRGDRGVRRAGLRGGLQLAVHGVRELVQAAPVRDADQERGEQLFNVWEYALVGPYQGAVGQRAVRQQLDDDRARVRPVALQRDVVD